MKIQVLQEKDPPAKISKLFSFQIRIQGEGRGGGQRGRCPIAPSLELKNKNGKRINRVRKRKKGSIGKNVTYFSIVFLPWGRGRNTPPP